MTEIVAAAESKLTKLVGDDVAATAAAQAQAKKLETLLGEDGMAELRELLAAQHPQRTGMAALLMGALKSWSVWLGGWAIALPELLPMISPYLDGMFSPDMYKRLMQIGGVLVILVRFKTTQSLEKTGGAP